jgi:hypothetical protein
MSTQPNHPVTADELAELVAAADQPPKVLAREVVPAGGSPAVLLAWGFLLPGRSWATGVSFIYTGFAGGPIRALVTIWLPSSRVARTRGETYLRVPRVILIGEPEDWPPLAPVYPGASESWLDAHHHAARVDPARRYGLRPTPARKQP